MDSKGGIAGVVSEESPAVSDEELEAKLFGDSNFKKADPETCLMMCRFRVNALVGHLVYTPKEKTMQEATYGLKRLQKCMENYYAVIKQNAKQH